LDNYIVKPDLFASQLH